MDRTLIANTTILDGSGAAPFPGDVLVEGQRIAAVQRGGGLSRDDARVIDGAGATVMPGLIEPHGHVSYPDAPSNSAFTGLPPEEHVLITMRNAKTIARLRLHERAVRGLGQAPPGHRDQERDQRRT